MANYEFSESLYADVRAVIGLGFDENTLPDETLALPVFQGETERWVMSNLEESQYTDPTQASAVNTAATYYLASLVLPTLVIVESERLPGGSINYGKTDKYAFAESLRSRATDAIAIVDDATGGQPSTLNPNFFTVAPRRRFC